MGMSWVTLRMHGMRWLDKSGWLGYNSMKESKREESIPGLSLPWVIGLVYRDEQAGFRPGAT